MGFDVDVPSVGLGFGAGVLTTIAIQRAWRYVQRFREDDNVSLQGYGTSAGRLGHRRYSRELIQYSQHHHLYGHKVALTDLLVEPRFIRPKTVAQLHLEDNEIDIYADIPLVYDHPYLYAPYNLPTMHIRDLGKGENTIAILGKPQSGRTTALQAIALFSLGQIDFQAPDDSVGTQIAKELESLKGDQRDKLIKERARLSQFNTLRFAEDEGLTKQELQNLENRTSPALQERAPLFLDAFNLNLDAFYRGDTDPAEPLIRGLQFGTKSLTRRTMPRTLYRLLANGQALVLIDNLDQLPETKRKQALQWLRAFTAQYHHNMVIVTFDLDGHKPVIEMGYAPVYLRAWHDQQSSDAIHRVATHWQQLTDTQTKIAPSNLEETLLAHRHYNPFELLLRIHGSLAGIQDRMGVYTADYIAQIIGRDDAWTSILARLGKLDLDNGIIKVDDLVKLALANHLTIPGISKLISNRENDKSNDSEPASSPGSNNDTQVEAYERREREIRREQKQLLKLLVKGNLLEPVSDGYRFIQRGIAHYCASLSINNDLDLHHVIKQPAWHGAIAFASERLPIDRAVAYHLNQPTDFMYRNICRLANWLAYAGENATWRENYLRLMGNLILAPQQYQVVRERLLAALLTTRDKGVNVIVQRAFQSSDLALKKLACLTLGSLEHKTAIIPLMNLLAHNDIHLQIVVGLSLAAIRDESAEEIIVEELQTSPNEHVRRAIAESLANNREIGYPTLYDAVQAEEMLLRRAAIFGLGRIETDWSLVAVNERYQMQDEEYYVKSAAEVVFINLFRHEKDGARPSPQPGAIPWVMTWGHEQINAGRINADIEGRELLTQALNYRDDLDIQLKAAKTLGHIGSVQSTRALYNALFDRQKRVRDETYRALTQIEMIVGQSLPQPNWQ